MMRESLKAITENTLVPLSMVISLLGGAGFVTYVYFQSDANAKAIIELKAKQDAMAVLSTDIAVIRVKVENIEALLSKK